MLTLVLHLLPIVFFAAVALGTLADPVDINRALGQALLDILNDYHVPVKTAAATMGLDESNLRKQLRGELGHELRISRVMMLGFPMFAAFWAAVVYVRSQQTILEVADSFNLRRQA